MGWHLEFFYRRTSPPKGVDDWAEGAWNFVEGAPEWQPLLHRLLADTCVTDTWEEAKALQASRPEATVICRDGRMISAQRMAASWQSPKFTAGSARV